MNPNSSASSTRQGAVTWSFGYWYRAWSAMLLASTISSFLFVVIGIAMLVDGEDPVVTAVSTVFASGLFGSIAWALRRFLRRNRVTIDELQREICLITGGQEQPFQFDDIQAVLTPAGASWPFPSPVKYRLENGTLVDGPMQHQGMYLRPRALKRFADLLAQTGISHVILDRP